MKSISIVNWTNKAAAAVLGLVMYTQRRNMDTTGLVLVVAAIIFIVVGGAALERLKSDGVGTVDKTKSPTA